MPAHRAYRRRRDAELAAAGDRLRLDRFRPRVQSGFVRNRVIDEVYLPLVGDALARQIGVSGAGRHTGRTCLNLGDVLDCREDLFALSHVENALTSHPVPAPLAARERSDLDLLVRMAEGDRTAHADGLAHPYPPDERDRIVAVLRNLFRVRDTVLRVNAAYIASAGQDGATRTEPPFLLQGSYRDTNRLAGRLSGVMNDEELEGLLDEHYAGEAQALASGAEAALLKLAELRGRQSPAQQVRWAGLKRALGASSGGPTGG